MSCLYKRCFCSFVIDLRNLHIQESRLRFGNIVHPAISDGVLNESFQPPPQKLISMLMRLMLQQIESLQLRMVRFAQVESAQVWVLKAEEVAPLLEHVLP